MSERHSSGLPRFRGHRPMRRQGQGKSSPQPGRMTAGAIGDCRRAPVLVRHVCDGGPQVPDPVDRNSTTTGPDPWWVADSTVNRTRAGSFSFVVAFDAVGCRIVGWSMASTPATPLVVDAQNMALAARWPREVIRYSDQGSRYASITFGHLRGEAEVGSCMGSVADAYDKALRLGMFAMLACERLAHGCLSPLTEARNAGFACIEGLHNPWRHHSSIGYAPPIGYVQRYHPPVGIPTHRSLPPCSCLSRTVRAAFDARLQRSLPAAARGRGARVRGGTKKWLRGPNQRTSLAEPRASVTLDHPARAQIRNHPRKRRRFTL